MNRLEAKRSGINRRTARVRASVSNHPRLSVHISNTNVTAQIIDDAHGQTLAYASSVGDKMASGSLTEKAGYIGKQIGLKAKKAKVSKVAFDRGARKYHGRIKYLADAAREQGLEF